MPGYVVGNVPGTMAWPHNALRTGIRGMIHYTISGQILGPMQTSTLAEQVSRTRTMARRPQEGSRRTTTTFGIYPLSSHGVRPHGSEGDKSKSYPRERLMGRTTRTRIRGACRIRAGSPGPKLGRPHDVYGHGYPSYEGSPTPTGAQDDSSPNACPTRTHGGRFRLHTLQGIKRQHEKDLRKN